MHVFTNEFTKKVNKQVQVLLPSYIWRHVLLQPRKGLIALQTCSHHKSYEWCQIQGMTPSDHVQGA